MERLPAIRKSLRHKRTAQSEDAEETPTVEIEQDKQQLIGVKTVEAAVKPMQKIIRTVGTY